LLAVGSTCFSGDVIADLLIGTIVSRTSAAGPVTPSAEPHSPDAVAKFPDPAA
jgi:hypothetical protein